MSELESTQAIIDVFNSLDPFTPGVLRKAVYPRIYVASSINGDNDLYTPVTGRKALVRDYIVTNNTGGAINHGPKIKIGGTYWQLGQNVSEGAGGLGHNYSMSPIHLSQPIILNAGETFSVNTSALGLTLWANIVEFADSVPLFRADKHGGWINGANTLYTVPANKTICMGQLSGSAVSNNPSAGISGLCYFNGSGGTVNLSTINIVPFGGSPGAANQFAAPGSIINGSGFLKFFHGNIGEGDFISVTVDSTNAQQFMWFNYTLAGE